MAMAYNIGNDDLMKYIKGVDEETGELILTNSREDAQDYRDGWFAETELEWMKFHFPEHEDFLNNCILLARRY